LVVLVLLINSYVLFQPMSLFKETTLLCRGIKSYLFINLHKYQYGLKSHQWAK